MTGTPFLYGSSKAGLALSTALPLFASVYNFLPSSQKSEIATASSDYSFTESDISERATESSTASTGGKDSRGFVVVGFSNSNQEQALENMYKKHNDPKWCKFHIKKGNETKDLNDIKNIEEEQQKGWVKDASLAAYKLLQHNINKACYEAKYGGKAYIEIRERDTSKGRVKDFFLYTDESKGNIERFFAYK